MPLPLKNALEQKTGSNPHCSLSEALPGAPTSRQVSGGGLGSWGHFPYVQGSAMPTFQTQRKKGRERQKEDARDFNICSGAQGGLTPKGGAGLSEPWTWAQANRQPPGWPFVLSRAQTQSCVPLGRDSHLSPCSS